MRHLITALIFAILEVAHAAPKTEAVTINTTSRLVINDGVINFPSGKLKVNGVEISGSGSTAWGSITGTLSSQSDLASALALKGDMFGENNLEELTSASTARTNLGLGTLATQSAGAVSISGGTITGTGIGASSLLLVDGGSPPYSLQFEALSSVTLTGSPTLTLDVKNASRTISLGGNLTVSSAATVSGTNTGDQTITLSGAVSGSGTGAITTTLGSNVVGSANITDGTVANADLAGSIDVTTKITGIVPPANLGTGSSITTKYLRGDGTWQTVSGTGDMLAANNLSDVASQAAAIINVHGWRTEDANSGTNDNQAPSTAGNYTGEVAFRNYGNLWWYNGIGWRSGFVLQNFLVDQTYAGADVGEIRISVSNATAQADNALALQNYADDHYSAVRFLNHTGDEKGALGWGNSNSGETFASALYFESYGGAADIRFVMGAGDGITAKFANTTGNFIMYDVNGTIASQIETLKITRATGALEAGKKGGNVTIGGAATASELRFLEPSGSGTNYTAVKAQAQASDITYTLPPDDGDAGKYLKTDGSGGLTWDMPGGITLATEQATTSGSTKDFSVPSGVKRITINFVGVSTDGTGDVYVQIGDSGGLETTGYVSCATQGGTSFVAQTSTSSYMIAGGTWNAGWVISGTMTLTLEDASDFTWCESHTFGRTGTAGSCYGGGHKSLSAELDRVSIITANAFDAGVINISYQ